MRRSTACLSLVIPVLLAAASAPVVPVAETADAALALLRGAMAPVAFALFAFVVPAALLSAGSAQLGQVATSIARITAARLNVIALISTSRSFRRASAHRSNVPEMFQIHFLEHEPSA